MHARLEQLKAVGDRLRSKTTSIAFLPGLLDAIDRVDKRLIEPPKGFGMRFLHLISGAPRIALARWLIRREIKRAVAINVTSRETALIAEHKPALPSKPTKHNTCEHTHQSFQNECEHTHQSGLEDKNWAV